MKDYATQLVQGRDFRCDLADLTRKSTCNPTGKRVHARHHGRLVRKYSEWVVMPRLGWRYCFCFLVKNDVLL